MPVSASQAEDNLVSGQRQLQCKALCTAQILIPNEAAAWSQLSFSVFLCTHQTRQRCYEPCRPLCGETIATLRNMVNMVAG